MLIRRLTPQTSPPDAVRAPWCRFVIGAFLAVAASLAGLPSPAAAGVWDACRQHLKGRPRGSPEHAGTFGYFAPRWRPWPWQPSPDAPAGCPHAEVFPQADLFPQADVLHESYLPPPQPGWSAPTPLAPPAAPPGVPPGSSEPFVPPPPAASAPRAPSASRPAPAAAAAFPVSSRYGTNIQEMVGSAAPSVQYRQAPAAAPAAPGGNYRSNPR